MPTTATRTKNGSGNPQHGRISSVQGIDAGQLERKPSTGFTPIRPADLCQLGKGLRPLSYLSVYSRTGNTILQDDNKVNKAIKDLYSFLEGYIGAFEGIVIRPETKPIEILEWMLKSYAEFSSDEGENWILVRTKQGYGLQFFCEYKDVDLYTGYGFEICHFTELEKRDPALFKALFNCLSLLFHNKHISFDDTDQLWAALDSVEQDIENNELDEEDKSRCRKYIAEYKKGGMAYEFTESIKGYKCTIEEFEKSIKYLKPNNELHRAFIKPLKSALELFLEPGCLGYYLAWDQDQIEEYSINFGDYPIWPQELFPILWRVDDADPVWSMLDWFFTSKTEQGIETIPLRYSYIINKKSTDLPSAPRLPYLQRDFFSQMCDAVEFLEEYRKQHWSPLLIDKIKDDGKGLIEQPELQL